MAKAALERTIFVTENGIRRKMTRREVAFWRLAEKAISGDIKALDFLLSLEQQGHDPETAPADANASSERALEMVQAFLDRQRVTKKG